MFQDGRPGVLKRVLLHRPIMFGISQSRTWNILLFGVWSEIYIKNYAIAILFLVFSQSQPKGPLHVESRQAFRVILPLGRSISV